MKAKGHQERKQRDTKKQHSVHDQQPESKVTPRKKATWHQEKEAQVSLYFPSWPLGFFLGVRLLSFLVSLCFLLGVTLLSFLCHFAFFLVSFFFVFGCDVAVFLFSWCHFAFLVVSESSVTGRRGSHFGSTKWVLQRDLRFLIHDRKKCKSK